VSCPPVRPNASSAFLGLVGKGRPDHHPESCLSCRSSAGNRTCRCRDRRKWESERKGPPGPRRKGKEALIRLSLSRSAWTWRQLPHLARRRTTHGPRRPRSGWWDVRLIEREHLHSRKVLGRLSPVMCVVCKARTHPLNPTHSIAQIKNSSPVVNPRPCSSSSARAK